MYADLFQDISLPCTTSFVPRWRKDGIVLSDGIQTTSNVKYHHRLEVVNDSVSKTYNLRIKNITLHDYGHYLCEVQSQNKIEIAQEVLLKKTGVVISNMELIQINKNTLKGGVVISNIESRIEINKRMTTNNNNMDLNTLKENDDSNKMNMNSNIIDDEEMLGPSGVTF
ncbi:unnamed protein product [Mytilus coruscus]|uniref:Uncharacterized protein n=1 Tax=Mytilus coruscus TaxID=42192 RepID=A0A6J8DZM8_MYTCO|nr:unnamed protein product [Mytilus coruscus]